MWVIGQEPFQNISEEVMRQALLHVLGGVRGEEGR